MCLSAMGWAAKKNKGFTSIYNKKVLEGNAVPKKGFGY
jgi:hypothetical protein